MDSFVLWGYTCLAASKTLLQELLTCLNFTLDSKDLFCWYKQKMNYGSSTSSWKPWRSVRLDLILTMSNIYINSNLNPHTKFTSSSRSTEFKDILSWKISHMITKTIPISTKIVKSFVIKWWHLAVCLTESQWKLRQQCDQNFPMEGKPM